MFGQTGTSAFLGGGGFGSTGTSFGFGVNNTSAAVNSQLGALSNTANASLNMSAATKQPFTLQKPPPGGAKRGKR